jgi:hypothetical protein
MISVLAQHQHQNTNQHNQSPKDLTKRIVSSQEANKREESQARRNDTVLNLQEVTPESHQKSLKKYQKRKSSCRHHAKKKTGGSRSGKSKAGCPLCPT